MSAAIELDDRRQAALKRAARRRHVPARQLLEQAVDEFLERAEDEELLERSERAAKRTGLRAADAVGVVREWRKGQAGPRRRGSIGS